ncbi:MAG: hypothetical protein E7Z67_02605 [Thermoplasmata archaeon]|nr:hypothetical protein [Thermoplasmata archaeon]
MAGHRRHHQRGYQSHRSDERDHREERGGRIDPCDRHRFRTVEQGSASRYGGDQGHDRDHHRMQMHGPGGQYDATVRPQGEGEGRGLRVRRDRLRLPVVGEVRIRTHRHHMHDTCGQCVHQTRLRGDGSRRAPCIGGRGHETRGREDDRRCREMKIRRVNIQSFGAITGFHEDFSGQNMVLIYGDNEAGKSTVAEFMRSTLFPGKNAKYPIAKKSDSGTLEVVMDDGGYRVLQRDQRKVVERDGKLLPSAEIRLDSETYRSLFGLDLEQLGNDKVITTGDLKRRFLTVPGGENVPEVSKLIRAEMDNLMTKERVTDTKVIGKYRKEVRRLDQEIAELQESIDGYNKMVSRLENLNEQLVYIHDMQDTANYMRNKEIMLESLKDNVATIEQLRTERLALEYSEVLTDEDLMRYDQLKSKLTTLDNLLDDLEDESEEKDGQMNSVQAERIMAMRDDIENVWGLKSRLDILSNALEDLRKAEATDDAFVRESCASLGLSESDIIKMESDPSVHEILINPRSKKVISAKFRTLLTRGKRVAYTLVSAAGVIAGLLIDSPVLASVSMVAGIAVNVAPSIIDTYFHVDDIDWNTWIPEKGFPDNITKQRAADMLLEADKVFDRMRRRDLSRERISAFEEERSAINDSVYSVLRDMGIDTGNVFGDLNEMYAQFCVARNIVESFSEADGLSDKRQQTEVEYHAILEKYGGEESLLRMRDDREKLKTLDIKLEALVKSVESASVKVDGIMSKEIAVSEDDDMMEEQALKDRIDEINQEIGHVTAEMAAIRGDVSIDDLKYARAVQNERYVESSKRWAVLSLADTIINECCDHFYSRLQPTVVRTANRYLSLMTGGRYQIVADPRSSDLTIEDRTGRKTLSEWSSGLGDQVLLSIKMAIAKELTDERIPFIMDDVLVRFDRDRKQGACRAIMEFAKDQQVIMFTCDRSLESAFKLEGEIKYLVM